MPDTSLGITYPASSGHARIWEHFQTLADQVDALLLASRTWTSYTPVWTAASSNPAIGNGSITGRYLQWGDLVFASGLISMGSSTTYGSGEWRLTLPVAAASLAYGGGGGIVDASNSTNDRAVGINLYSATQIRFFTATGPASAAVPFAWQNTDTVNWTAVYEAA
ncbi:hypothetical protein ABNF97_09430 [Plantactinospora sp. B6F1]|uniref:hypothetical protein n=1 Tax=Plantactinospora sp. B6F1 TaxID=3158971 RepID=UPI0032D9A2FD